MTVALILDPFFGEVDLEGFQRLARERHGWTFSRLSFNESQADHVSFFPKLYTAVERADVLLCFGNYNWFHYCRYVGGLYERIEQKLAAGSPFASSICSCVGGIKFTTRGFGHGEITEAFERFTNFK